MVAGPGILSLEEVLRSMGNGDAFVTKDPKTGKEALVRPFTCSGCKKEHIRTSPDAEPGNSLDSLPTF